jgi:hypothetical protein
MGVKPPANATGRILAEGLENPPANVAPRQQKLKEFDYLLRDVGVALEAAQKAGAQTTALEGRYYRIERILEWQQFGTIDQLIEHHRQLLGQLRALAAPPVP